ncbi:MAG: DoxX family membrane protein [Verrucomicrobiaceae bacterium]|nr:MAG: DoxX family membrane protein [Verrucomicrobiaceae bacterium]
MKLRDISRIILAVFFIAAGVNHFISPGIYLPMMPDYLPWHLGLIYVSGVAEVAGGIGICIPKWRRAAGWGLIALLIAIFPANLHMALNDIPLNGKHLLPWVLWFRLPFQLVMIAWVYWSVLLKKPEAQ